MRTPLFFLALLALTGPALADIPHKAPLTRYTGLWTNSPFTTKPPPDAATGPANPLSDYALAGVSPIDGGYRVTLLNRKKPDERITVDSHGANSDFKILAVNRKPGDPLGTTVRMANGANTGFISFDEKLLVLKTVAPTRPNANAQQQNGDPQNNGAQQNPGGAVPPGQQPNQNQGTQDPNAQTRRPRVIPPAGNTNQNNGQQNQQFNNRRQRQGAGENSAR